MNYEEFKKNVITDLPAYLTGELEGAEIVGNTICKTNKTVDVFTLQGEGIYVSLALHAEPLYMELLDRNEGWENFLKRTAYRLYEYYREGKKLIKENTYEKLNDTGRIFFKLVNAERNRELLEKVPHKRMHDLAFFCNYLLDTDNSEEPISTRIDYKIMEHMGLEESELFRYAYENTKKLFPTTCMGMNEIMMHEICGIKIQEGETTERDSIYVMTNCRGKWGATAMIYSEPLHELADRLESDLYILPSSVHEIIILPADQNIPDTEELKKMVYEVNRTEVDEGDILSDNIYHCSRKDRKITMV